MMIMMLTNDEDKKPYGNKMCVCEGSIQRLTAPKKMAFQFFQHLVTERMQRSVHSHWTHAR